MHELELAPYFLAKHEVTQAQWLRCTGEDPSQFRPPAVASRLNPVECVSAEEAEAALRYWGLRLPTEAQWEYAARAGTQTPWWSGSSEDALARLENLVDAAAKARNLTFAQDLPADAFDDGFPVHGPVGSMAANPFGLHDMLGNVAEWCRDGFRYYRRGGVEHECVTPGDCLRVGGDPGTAVARGGSFYTRPATARASYRSSNRRAFFSANLGLRAARLLDR